MTREEISETRRLYSDIDNCITELLKARTEKDSDAEGKALFRMESLMVGTLQHLAYLIEHQELPSELEEAAEKFTKDEVMVQGEFHGATVARKVNKAFIAGAEHQRKQDQQLIELAEDHAMLAGMNKMKEEMMEKAVEGRVFMSFAPGHNKMVMADVDLPTNTKVCVIVIPEENLNAIKNEN